MREHSDQTAGATDELVPRQSGERQMAPGYRVRQVTPGDYAKLGDLLLAVWGRPSAIAFWEWRFAFTRSPSSGVVVEDSSGAIVAYTGLFGQMVFLNGREISAEWIVDLMAHPAHKGKAYPLLMAELKKVPYRSFIGGFHNDDGGRITKAVLRRTNSYRLSAHIPRYCLFLDPSLAIKNRFSGSLRALTSAVYRMVFGLSRRLRNCEIILAGNAGPEFDDLWKRTGSGYAFIQYRGSDYVRWRFMAMWGREHQVWTARENGVVEGYMVTTLVSDQRGCHGTIVDWLLPRERTDLFGLLLRNAIRFFITRKVWCVELFVMDHERQWIDLLRGYLFVKRQGRVYSIWVRDEVVGGAPIAEPLLFLTPGDSDFPGADEGREQ